MKERPLQKLKRNPPDKRVLAGMVGGLSLPTRRVFVCFVVTFVFLRSPRRCTAALLGVPTLSRGVRHFV